MFGFFRGRTSPPASMEYVGSVHFRLACSRHLSSIWFSEPCCKLFGHTILRPSRAERYILLRCLHILPSVPHERPNDARHFVRQCDYRDHWWLSSKHVDQPFARATPASPGPRHDCASTHDQKSPERGLSHFRRSSKALFAATRPFKRGEPNPSRKVAPLSKCLWGRRESSQSCRSYRADARYRH